MRKLECKITFLLQKYLQLAKSPKEWRLRPGSNGDISSAYYVPVVRYIRCVSDSVTSQNRLKFIELNLPQYTR